MRFTRVMVFAVFMLSAQSLFAQDTTAPKKPETSKIKPYAEVINARAISKPGLFTVHKVDEKYYFEIPDQLLQKELLSTTRLSKVPAGSPKYGGEIVNAKTIAFEKGPANNIYLKVITLVAVADSTDAIAKAVRNANVDPIAMVFDIKARGKDNNSTVIEVTDFYQKDNNITGFDADAKKQMRLGGAAADKSYIVSVNPYPINIETRTVKTFSVSMGGGSPAGETQSADAVGVGVTMELSTSIMLMPERPMQQRYFDPRVGYFADNYKVFSDDQQRVEEKTFIVRFRLEPKAEDIAKYKKGKLVEPKEPIVFYVDPATPKQWRPYIIAGINDWNAAFEKAGFRNAIVGKEWPENDTTMSLEDARYKVVRYFPSEIPNAYGPNVHDPRTGEILQSYVGWYHSIMRLLHSMYFTQMAAVDPRARSMKFSDELMGTLIRFAVSHEIGHTLGLRHNMGSSSQTPVEKLRDKKWVEANGHTVSIMDYARFNYVAQPGDNISEKGIMPRIGDYDKWAIQWGYRYTGAATAEDDKKIITKWVIDSLKSNPRLWFGGEGGNRLDPIDPRSQREDLSDNGIKAGEYGIKNLKIIMRNLLQWTHEDNDMYENAMDMYDKLGGQYQTYIQHVMAYIGGAYENIKTVEQTGDVYSLVPKQAQKEAMAFLHKEVFQTPSWLFDKEILNKFRKPVRNEWPQKIQETTLTNILSTGRLYRMTMQSMRFGDAAYSVDEMLTDLNKGLWSELQTHKPIDSYRRLLQKRYVDFSIQVLNLPKSTDPAAIDITNTDIPVALRSQLENVRKSCLAAMPSYKDDMTIAHLKYIADKIEFTLNGQRKGF